MGKPFSLFRKSETARMGTDWKLTGPPPVKEVVLQRGDGRLSRAFGLTLGYPTEGTVRHAAVAFATRCLSSLSDTRPVRSTHPGLYLVGRERLMGSSPKKLMDGKVVPLSRPRPLPRFTPTILGKGVIHTKTRG